MSKLSKGGLPLSRNLYLRVQARKFYSRKQNRGKVLSVELKLEVDRSSTFTFASQAAQTHYMNADVTLACERCCVTNGYLQSLVWDVNGFS